MNILFISALEIKEKGAQSIRMTLEGYAKAGHGVILITTKKPHSKDYFYEEEYTPKSDNLKIIRIWLPLGRLSQYSGKINRLRELYLFSVFAFLRGIFVVPKEKIDIIYGYEVRGVYPSFLLSKIFRKKLVTRFQGTLLYPLIKKRDTDKKSWRRVWDHRLAMKLKSDLYIMTNDGTLGDKVLECFKAPKDKIRFWMNGVNKSIYQPKYKEYLHKRYKIPKNEKILVTVHRLTYWKKTERAIHALREVIKKEKNTHLVIIGDGERKKELAGLVKRLKLDKNVIFTGGVPNKEIAKYLNGADIYLGTYDLSNAGNPLFESMLAGLAVISLSNGSTADFLDSGRAGILIKDEKEFAPNILKLVGDEKELKRWKKLAKDYSHQKFWSWGERISAEIKETEKLLNS